MLQIKSGHFDYSDLLHKAELQLERINVAFQQSSIREVPDLDYLDKLLVEIRTEYYHGS